MTHILGAVLAAPIPSTSLPPILTALGITSSVISFVLTNILARPSMIRWRGLTWRTFACLWLSVGICFVDLVYQRPILGAWNLGTKFGLSFWVCGLFGLLFLVKKISLVSFDRPGPAWMPRRRARTREHRFHCPRVPTFGVPFLDGSMGTMLPVEAEMKFPILLISDRTAHGFRMAQQFVAQGLVDGEGVVWLVFTRPWAIVVPQITSPLKDRSSNWVGRAIIVDCYSRLYFSAEERRDLGDAPPGIEVRYCDPRDPVSVKDQLKKALRDLQATGATGVRVLYDSLSDFISVADRELLVPYLRWSIVWEELHKVQSMYLVWPDVLAEPVSAEYLTWFGNTVLKLKDAGDHYTAVVETVGNPPIRLDYDDRLEVVSVSPPEADGSVVARFAGMLDAMWKLLR